MEYFRSKSCGDGRNLQIQSYYDGGGTMGPISSGSGATSMQDLRCYSSSYASSVCPAIQTQMAEAGNGNDFKFKKGTGKSTANGSSAPFSKSWSFNDPELQRKRRVASYKVYAVEGKVKGSFRKSFRWIKDRCSRAVYG